MSLTIKIQEAPPQDGESLCRTCRYAHIQRGFRQSEETVLCGYIDTAPRLMKFKVASCTDYINRTLPARWELEDLALLINVEPARKRAGFRNSAAVETPEEDVEPDLSAVK